MPRDLRVVVLDGAGAGRIALLDGPYELPRVAGGDRLCALDARQMETRSSIARGMRPEGAARRGMRAELASLLAS